MSEFDDELQDIDYQMPFDQERANVDDLLAKLDRIQRALARREKAFSAEIEAYNAAIMAAFDHLDEVCSEYRRFADSASQVCSDIVFEMSQQGQEKEEASPEWGQSEEGRRHEKWLDVWDAFEHKSTAFNFGAPEPIKLPETPLSEMIADLPRRPGDLEPSDVPRAAADRPIDPEVAATVASSWRRIDAWLSANAPMLASKMGNGATPEAIAEAERAFGVELPEAVRASYLIHDGSGGISIFPSGDYLSLEGMLDQYRCWKELLDDGILTSGTASPRGPIRNDDYNLKWIPLTHDGAGDHTLIDLAPAEGGKVGQLIDFGHEGGPEGVAAPGLAEYLAYLADGLEAGAGVVEKTYVEWTRGEEWTRSGYGPIPARSASKGVSSGRHFEFTAGTSNKFWEISCEGFEMTTRYGKIGTKGQTSTKSFDSPEKAAAETAKIIAKKVKEGYVEKTP